MRDLVDAVSAAIESIEYINDPAHLQITYDYIALCIKKHLECVVAKLLALFKIACCFVILIIQALSRLLCVVVQRSSNRSLPNLKIKSRKRKRRPRSRSSIAVAIDE